MANKENLIRTVSITEKDAKDALESVKKALADKDLVAYAQGKKDLEDKVKVWNAAACKVKYAEFLEAENPMTAAIKAFYVDVVKIKEEVSKEDGSITDIKFDDTKKARVDLEKFCEFGDLDTTWCRDADKLLVLLTLRETNVFAIKPSELTKKSFYFIEQVNKKINGETPDSNTQVVKLLQKIIDAVIGNGAYRCTNHDLIFIHDAVTKLDTKDKCTIAMLNSRQFKTVLMSVFAHCLGESYKVKAAKVKKSDT